MLKSNNRNNIYFSISIIVLPNKIEIISCCECCMDHLRPWLQWEYKGPLGYRKKKEKEKGLTSDSISCSLEHIWLISILALLSKHRKVICFHSFIYLFSAFIYLFSSSLPTPSLDRIWYLWSLHYAGDFYAGFKTK